MRVSARREMEATYVGDNGGGVDDSPLELERGRAGVNAENVAAMLAGSAKKLAKRREIRKIIEEDKVMAVDDYYFCDRSRKYERALEKTVRFVQLVRMNGWKDDDAIDARRCIREQLPVGLHWVRWWSACRGEGERGAGSKAEFRGG